MRPGRRESASVGKEGGARRLLMLEKNERNGQEKEESED